jgi:hypothetical protein
MIKSPFDDATTATFNNARDTSDEHSIPIYLCKPSFTRTHTPYRIVQDHNRTRIEIIVRDDEFFNTVSEYLTQMFGPIKGVRGDEVDVWVTNGMHEEYKKACNILNETYSIITEMEEEYETYPSDELKDKINKGWANWRNNLVPAKRSYPYDR